MDLITSYLLPCLWAFCACVGFGLVFNIQGFGILICGGGGARGWFVYLTGACFTGRVILRYLIAAVVIALYSEVMARLRRCPVTSYLIIALLPMVPGGGIYNAMRYCAAGDNQLFLSTLVTTLGIAGALALGAVLGSSLFRLLSPATYRSHK